MVSITKCYKINVNQLIIYLIFTGWHYKNYHMSMSRIFLLEYFLFICSLYSIGIKISILNHEQNNIKSKPYIL